MFLSIIIPTKDRNAILFDTLHRAIEAVENEDAEIIVVNDSEHKIQLPSDLTSKIKLFQNTKKGVSAARNYGASIGTGDILFFIDDDMWISKESIRQIRSLAAENEFEKNCVCLNWEYPSELAGKLKNSKIGRYILTYHYNTMEGRMHRKIDYSKSLDTDTSIGSCSFVISKKLFASLGGYDESIIFQGEDIDLSRRLNQNKIPIKILSKITAYHNHQDRLDIEGFLDRTFRGYLSQINANIPNYFPPLKSKIYLTLLPLSGFFKRLFTIIPNVRFFDMFSFRLIGILSSLTYFKALKHSNQQQ